MEKTAFENIEELMTRLPENYEQACFESKAIERVKEIKTPKMLMKLCLVYLLYGWSFIDVTVVARAVGLCNISDVALMKKFWKCNDWFEWILSQMNPPAIVEYAKPDELRKYNIKALDASDVTLKGIAKTVYRLHYCIEIFSLKSDQYKITDVHTGEKLRNFTLVEYDLILADRAYGTIQGMEYCLECNADFIFRLRNNAFSLYDENRKRVYLYKCLSRLGNDENLDMEVYFRVDKDTYRKVRVIAKKRPQDKIDADKQRADFMKLSAETQLVNQFTVLVTSLPYDVSTKTILETYRYRWQVELYFKRLKSLMDFGELPTKKDESVKSWLNGKMIAALLIEKAIASVDFSPSGE